MNDILNNKKSVQLCTSRTDQIKDFLMKSVLLYFFKICILDVVRTAA